MTNKYLKASLFVSLFISTSALFSQNVAINTSGNPPSASAILDLSNTANMGFLPPQVALANVATLAPVPGPGPAGLIVYNTSNTTTGGSGAGYYYWNGVSWIYLLTSSAAAGWSTTGNTGTNPALNYAGTGDPEPFIIKTSGAERMRFLATGGAGIGTPTPQSAVDVNGNMSIGTYAGVNAAPANGVIISGHVGIGTSTPQASSVIDLTNTQATGGTGNALMWCQNPNPTANITAPVLGEEIYNTTTGCFNFYNGTNWAVMGCPCTVAPATPTITASCSSAFLGSTVTYISSVNTGCTFNWTVTATSGTPTITGQGTATITVTWPNTTAGTGTVILSLTNLCGTTTASQTVTIYAPAISGPTNVATSSTGNVYTMSVPGATYAWSFTANSNGASIIGSATAQSVTVNAGPSTGGYTLQCVVTFGGCSYTVSYAVTANPCSGIILKDPNAASAAASGYGLTTLNITTSNTNDMVLINVGGYGTDANLATVTYSGAGTGTATYYVEATGGGLGPTEIFWFPAVAAGTYHITVTEPASYYAGYYQNEAVALTGFCSTPTAADLLVNTTKNYTNCADVLTVVSGNIAVVANSYLFAAINNYWYASGAGPETYTGTTGAWATLSESNATSGGCVSSIGGSAQSTATAAYATTGHDAGGWCYGSLIVIDVH